MRYFFLCEKPDTLSWRGREKRRRSGSDAAGASLPSLAHVARCSLQASREAHL